MKIDVYLQDDAWVFTYAGKTHSVSPRGIDHPFSLNTIYKLEEKLMELTGEEANYKQHFKVKNSKCSCGKLICFWPNMPAVEIQEEGEEQFCEYCGETENLTRKGDKTICDICLKYRVASVQDKELERDRKFGEYLKEKNKDRI